MTLAAAVAASQAAQVRHFHALRALMRGVRSVVDGHFDFTVLAGPIAEAELTGAAWERSIEQLGRVGTEAPAGTNLDAALETLGAALPGQPTLTPRDIADAWAISNGLPARSGK